MYFASLLRHLVHGERKESGVDTWSSLWFLVTKERRRYLRTILQQDFLILLAGEGFKTQASFRLYRLRERRAFFPVLNVFEKTSKKNR